MNDGGIRPLPERDAAPTPPTANRPSRAGEPASHAADEHTSGRRGVPGPAALKLKRERPPILADRGPFRIRRHGPEAARHARWFDGSFGPRRVPRDTFPERHFPPGTRGSLFAHEAPERPAAEHHTNATPMITRRKVEESPPLGASFTPPRERGSTRRSRRGGRRTSSRARPPRPHRVPRLTGTAFPTSCGCPCCRPRSASHAGFRRASTACRPDCG